MQSIKYACVKKNTRVLKFTTTYSHFTSQRHPCVFSCPVQRPVFSSSLSLLGHQRKRDQCSVNVMISQVIWVNSLQNTFIHPPTHTPTHTHHRTRVRFDAGVVGVQPPQLGSLTPTVTTLKESCGGRFLTPTVRFPGPPPVVSFFERCNLAF